MMMKPPLTEGVELWKRGELSRAGHFFKAIIREYSEYGQAWANLGNVYKDMGLLYEADHAYKRALELNPDAHWIESNRLFCLNYRDDVSKESLLREHADFRSRLGELENTVEWKNVRERDRRLSLGFVSGDLRSHSVAFFLTGLWRELDRNSFELNVFSENRMDDEMTDLLRSLADAWVDTAGMSSESFIKTIRRSRIDVLIDLSGHTAYNRLPEFAQKLAPVQISWLGYPAPVGLGNGHGFMIPPGEWINDVQDALITIEKGAHAYECPIKLIPEKSSFNEKEIRFGCFNNRSKVTPQLIVLWAEILRSLPQSKLYLKSRAYLDNGVQEAILSEFQKYNINPKCIEFMKRTDSIAAHLSIMQSMDIMLDTSPYNGTTTTFEALSMGVPVITLESLTPASRVGATILSQLGQTDWIAKSGTEYVVNAIEISENLDLRKTFARNARQQLFETGLSDSRSFARRWEKAVRRAWSQFCEESS